MSHPTRTVTDMVRLISWNMAHQPLWGDLRIHDADIALVQESARPPKDIETVPSGDVDWRTVGWEQCDWRTAIVRLSRSVGLEPHTTVGLGGVTSNRDLGLSRDGTLTAAKVLVDGQPAITVASVYAKWERPLGRDQPCWADASAHRLLSDLTPLLWDQRRHPVVIAGDWNILHGYGEHGDPVWAARYATVFERARSLGLRLVGPFAVDGEKLEPWPAELPTDSRCVPTYHHSRQTPATATRQLDFVFASESIADRVTARAHNSPGEWGPSDHCRILIDVEI